MTVNDILAVKGRDVTTISPDRTVQEAAVLLAQLGIGALVVTDSFNRIVGILSERDVVRAIGQSGSAALQGSVEALMTKQVTTCHDDQNTRDLLEIMTAGRFRHIPVEKNGFLDGIVSIGDVVKRRLEDVEREAEEIKLYIATG
ncbi:CBS domain-containing protein [Tianweitania sediminis]|uniref:CBS domain-containing protein n=1 Tax=Tianweitania sediminis TaxID=1502156 RepID=A0A8J7UN10_9HYPH|nr:CBS domain-containing protein [Tianweitania sediminis]MBP0440992.1 CBS domain-containing protein [Tianweitania sediminis]